MTPPPDELTVNLSAPCLAYWYARPPRRRGRDRRHERAAGDAAVVCAWVSASSEAGSAPEARLVEPHRRRDLLDVGPRFGDARRRQILLDRLLLALAGPERQEDDQYAERRHRAHRRRLYHLVALGARSTVWYWAMTDKFVTLPEIRKHAKKVLPRDAWNFGDGGAETETTLRRNHRAISPFHPASTYSSIRQSTLPTPRPARDAWNFGDGGAETETTLRRNHRAINRLAIRQDVLVDIREIDLSTRLLGLPLSWPVAVAPMGGLILFHPQGDVEMARGAAQGDTLQFLSGASGWPVEDVAKASPGPKMFQLYHHGDRAWAADLMARVEASGTTPSC